MANIPTLISDLALILITAAVVTLVFRKLKQPLVLGYILAGFIVSPYFSFTPNVIDEHNIEIWADIGVIFLLFSLGLEFSFKKLLKEGATTLVTAAVKIVAMLAAGYLLGWALGWSQMNSLFLGCMLSVSSTMIVLKAFEEFQMKNRNFARVVLGVLIMEDIVVVLLMVMLSTIAATQQIEGGELLITILKLGFFLILWILMGVYIIPTFLKKTKKLLDEEVLLILSLGLCLGMAMLATFVGFSTELGAFIMGSILATTTAAEKIEHLLKPVKDLFGAIFFVSIGMLINPQTLWEYKWIVLAVTVLTIVGKLIFTTTGALLSGQSLRQSVQVGMSMAQVSEFAFIVATLGMTLGVISDFLFPVAVGAAVITTFTTPYMIKYADSFYAVLAKIIPQKLQEKINSYSASSQVLGAETAWKKLLNNYLQTVLLNGVIILSIILLSVNLVVPFINRHLTGELSDLLALLLTLAATSPFLWALMFKRPKYMTRGELWENPDYNRRQLYVVEILRIFVGILLIGYLCDSFIGTKLALLVVLPVFLLALFLFSKYFAYLYKKIEGRFIENLTVRERAEAERQAPMQNLRNRLRKSGQMTAWDVHLADLQVPQNAKYIGRTLAELRWRERFEVNVIYIKRGEHILYSPGPASIVLPFDHLGVFGSDEVLEKFKTAFLAENHPKPADCDIDDIVVEKHVIELGSPLSGVAIKDSKIRETTGGIVVAIERGETRILSPAPATVFEAADVVWIVGEKSKLKKLAN